MHTRRDCRVHLDDCKEWNRLFLAGTIGGYLEHSKMLVAVPVVCVRVLGSMLSCPRKQTVEEVGVLCCVQGLHTHLASWCPGGLITVVISPTLRHLLGLWFQIQKSIPRLSHFHWRQKKQWEC